ncbi:MAG: Dockerin type domain [Planctomycetota bacterium]
MNIVQIACAIVATGLMTGLCLADGVVKGQTATKKVVVEEVSTDIVEVKVLAKTSTNTWVVADDLTSEANQAEQTAPALGSITDCNDNGIDDATDIASGTADDIDGDGKPDSCEIAAGDVNLNGVVNGSDASIVLGWWGLEYSPTSDCNFDGTVDGMDLAIVLAAFGSTP